VRPNQMAWLLALAVTLAGCASYRPPKPILPTAAVQSADPALDTWWTSFGDQTLAALVDEALAHNADVLTAIQSVEKSKSSLRQARLTLIPDVSATGSVTRQRSSDFTAPPGQTGTRTTYQEGFSASYEIDLWGRAWNAKSAILAQLRASRYARETTRAAVAAQAARSYFALLALDARVDVLHQTQATRQTALELQQQRYRAGASGDYELQLAQSELASVAASVPTAVAAREQAEASLAALLGRSPREVFEGHVTRGTALETLVHAPEIPAGLPADLLIRRPDVRQAEATLAAAAANLRETRGRYFPRISLTGFFGGESLQFSQVADAAARSWTVAGAVTQPLVGLLNTRAQVRTAKATRAQAEIAYAQAARAAYADTRSALASHVAARDALIATAQRRDSVTRVKEITEQRYQGGAASYLDLLNAERDRLAAENDQVTALQNRLDAMVNVYQALGGGWSSDGLVR
jgi:outer membrane protein, multidrug efflux system